MDKNSIGKGVVYLYVEAITMLFSGYIYWLILSKLIDPSSIGLASAIIAFATISFSFASVGVAGGIQRYIANSIVEKKPDLIQSMINSALLITGLGSFVSSIVILIFKDSVSNYLGISIEYILLSLVLSVFLVFSLLLRAIIIPSLKVKVITITSIVSTVVKFSVTVALVLLGFGVLGIILGFLTYPVISTLIFTFAIKKKIYKIVPIQSLFVSTKEILIASITVWIPLIITTVGSQLGTLTVFVAVGSNKAGIYFIAFSLITGITVIITVLSSIAFPTISTIKDGKKRAAWRLIKLSLILTIPISNILIFYPAEVLTLFGSSYTGGSLTLQTLALTSLPTCISTGIGVLLYSYGNNRGFLLLGLVTSLPRVLLYFPFVYILGENGAALSFLIGAICGASLAIIYSKKIRMNLHHKQVLILFMIPVIIAFPLKSIDLSPFISVLIILISSYFTFIFLKLIDSQDIDDILRILPSRLAKVIYFFYNLKLKSQKDK